MPKKSDRQAALRRAQLAGLYPHTLPARVIYTLGGGVTAQPDLVPSPDQLSPVVMDAGETRADGSRATHPHRLTMRADRMARFVAHGATLSDAFRACYAPKEWVSSKTVALRANRVARTAGWRRCVEEYRLILENEARQAQIPMRDFVLGRLTVEAQDAHSDAARIKALELLGKTESLFVDVKRTERAINPGDLERLKTQLAQRVSDALARLVNKGNLDRITAIMESPVAGLGPDPHPPTTPLVADGSHPPSSDTILPKPLPLISATPSIPLVPSSHREMTEDDL